MSAPLTGSPPRPILVAEILAIGTELTAGETTDTNTGELARSLTAMGITVTRILDLPDDPTVVTDALHLALGRVDLVVTTGGLGPTPDDLTREAVAAACGEETSVDPGILAWLEGLWARRRQPFPAANVKQAWTIPSATILPNPNGTAPGWWVDRPDGRVLVTLPGPPRELRPMWADHVVPRLATRGAGAETEVRTLRLTGIGESQVADLLGGLLHGSNPIVATYARAEAVDVRISAWTTPDGGAGQRADVAESAVRAILGSYIWATGSTTWSEAIKAALATPGWTLATVERGTGGALVTLLGALPRRLRAEVIEIAGDDLAGDAETDDADGAAEPGRRAPVEEAEAVRVRATSGADVGLAVRATPRGEDTAVHVAVATPHGVHAERRIAFLRGSHGRDRAAIAAAAVLLATLRDENRRRT